MYVIDYRNGGMGNTVLAHILFSSKKIDFDIELFFSSSGNAHVIQDLNRTNLTALHLIEFPNSDVCPILKLVTKDWTEMLRLKMSYNKWYEQEPGIQNYHLFFNNNVDVNSDLLWQQFYNDIKDSSWPDCNSFEESSSLPTYIQDEIKAKWEPANFVIDTDLALLEFLTISYYDMFTNPKLLKDECKTYYLDQYLNGDLTTLEQLANELGWEWDWKLSDRFHKKMLHVNSFYLQWLDNIKTYYKKISHGHDVDIELKTWEVAAILAKICVDTMKNPRFFYWQNLNCSTPYNSVKLHKLLGL